MALDFLELNAGFELLNKTLALLQNTLIEGAQEFTKFEKLLVSVGRSANISGAALKDLGESLDALSKSTGTSKEELFNLAKAAALVGQTGDKLLPFVTTINKISIALGISGEEANRAFESFKQLFGLASGDAEKFANSLSAVAKAAGLGVQQVSASAESLGLVAREFNITGVQAAALGASLTKLGVDSGTGGLAISRILNGITQDADKFAKVLNLDANELRTLVASDSLAALQKFSGAFNELNQAQKRAASQELGLGNFRLAKTLDALALSTEKVTKLTEAGNRAFEEGDSVSAAFAAKQELLGTKLSRLEATAGDLNEKAFAPFEELLKKVVDQGTEFLAKFAEPVEDFFKKLVEPVTLAIEGIKLFAVRVFEAGNRLVAFFGAFVNEKITDFATFLGLVVDGLDRIVTFATGGTQKLSSFTEEVKKAAEASKKAAAASKEHGDAIKDTSEKAEVAVDAATKAREAQEAQLKGAIAGSTAEISAYNEAVAKTSKGLTEQIGNEDAKLRILKAALATHKDDSTIINAIAAVEFKRNVLVNARLKAIQDEAKISRELLSTREEIAKLEDEIAGKTGDSSQAIAEANRKIKEQGEALKQADEFHTHSLEIELAIKQKIAATDEKILGDTKKASQTALENGRAQQQQVKDSFDSFLAQQRAALAPDGVAKNIRNLGDSFKSAFKAGIPSRADLSEALGLFSQNVAKNIKDADAARAKLLQQRNETGQQFNAQIQQLQEQLGQTKDRNKRAAIQNEINQLVSEGQAQVAAFDKSIDTADEGLADARQTAGQLKDQLKQAGEAGLETAKRMADQVERLAEAAERAAKAFEAFAIAQAKSGSGSDAEKEKRGLQVKVDQLQELLNAQEKRLTTAGTDAEKLALQARIADTKTQLQLAEHQLQDATILVNKEHEATATKLSASEADKRVAAEKLASSEDARRKSEDALKKLEEAQKNLDKAKEQASQPAGFAAADLAAKKKASDEAQARVNELKDVAAPAGSEELLRKRREELLAQAKETSDLLRDTKFDKSHFTPTQFLFGSSTSTGAEDRLTKKGGDLNIEVKDIDAKLKASNDLRQAELDAAKAKEDLDAATKANNEVEKAAIKNSEDLAAAQEKVNKASEIYQASLEKVQGATEKASTVTDAVVNPATFSQDTPSAALDAAAAQQNLGSQLGDVAGKLSETTASQTNLADNFDKFSNSLDNLLATQQDVGKSVDGLSEALGATLKNINSEAAKTAAKLKDIAKGVSAVNPQSKLVSDASGLPSTFGAD